MIFRVLCAAMLLLIGFSGTASSQVAAFKPRLGCVPFMATSLQAMAFTENISSSLLDSIDKTGHFEVMERKKVEHYIEIEGQRLDNLNHDGIVRVGLKAGLDYVVHGSVSMTEAGATSLEVNLIAVRSKKSLMRETFRITESTFTRQLQGIAAEIVVRVKQALQQPAVVKEVASQTVPQPQRVSASGTPSSIRLTWQLSAMEQIAGFNIYRSVNADGPFSLHGTATEPLFVDDRLKLNEVFYYRISAVSTSGAGSELTAPVRGATVIAPPAPIFLNIQTDIKGARLSWRARPGTNTDSGSIPTGFRIYRSSDSDSSLTLVAQLPVETQAYYDVNLKDGIKYVYSLTACNREGAESELSARLSVIPLSGPKTLKATGGLIRQISLNWDVYSAESAVGYALYRSSAPDGAYVQIARLDGLSRTSFIDKDLADNTVYWYRLSAYKKDGTATDPSEAVSAKTRDLPPKPVNLAAIGGQPRKVTLTWQNQGVPEDEISRLIIYRALAVQEPKFEKIDEVSAGSTVYVDDKKPLLDKTAYLYHISSLNSGGAASLPSDNVSAVTKAPPEAPAQLAAKSGLVKKVALAWQKNREADIREYRVARKLSGEIQFREIGSAVDSAFEDMNLPDGAEAGYAVRAVDADGLVSGYSDVVSAQSKPVPGKVTGLRIADRASRLLEWQAGKEADLVGYVIYKKGFLGGAQKVATVTATNWKPDEIKERAEYHITALDASGLESPPSEPVSFE